MKNLIDRFLNTFLLIHNQANLLLLLQSTAKQMFLTLELKKKWKKLGLQEISLDEHTYLMASLPANITKPIPTIGFYCSFRY